MLQREVIDQDFQSLMNRLMFHRIAKMTVQFLLVKITFCLSAAFFPLKTLNSLPQVFLCCLVCIFVCIPPTLLCMLAIADELSVSPTFLCMLAIANKTRMLAIADKLSVSPPFLCMLAFG